MSNGSTLEELMSAGEDGHPAIWRRIAERCSPMAGFVGLSARLLVS